MCVVARQDLCCGKTRSLLWQDIKESTKGGGAKRRPPLWRRPKAASFMSCHKRDLVLPQQRSCLATTHILSCHNRHLVSPKKKHVVSPKNKHVFVCNTDSSPQNVPKVSNRSFSDQDGPNMGSDIESWIPRALETFLNQFWAPILKKTSPQNPSLHIPTRGI